MNLSKIDSSISSINKLVLECDELKDAINIYHWGSRVYGCSTAQSDWDFICVMPDGWIEKNNTDQCFTVMSDMEFTFNFESVTSWQEKIGSNAIEALECSFLPSKFVVKENKKFPITIDYDKVRHTISRVSSIAWVKGLNKLSVHKDYNQYVGRKSIWHSLRLFMFGIQIMKYDKIVDYTEGNIYYDDIIHHVFPADIKEAEGFKALYQGTYNRLHSEFKLAHLEALERSK